MLTFRKKLTIGLLACALVPAYAGPSLSQDATDPAATTTETAPQKSIRELLRTVATGEPAADLAVALETVTKAANDGNSSAAVALGDAYRNGKVVEGDLQTAVGWYEKALAAGNTRAVSRLGTLIYTRGEEAGIDPVTAITYLEQAAASGDGSAALMLGDIYREGKIVTADLTKAGGYFEQAAETGNTTASRRLAALYRTADAAGLDKTKSVAVFETAIAAGDAGAMIGLADVYREGQIAPKDLVKAQTLYEQALAKGNRTAALKLAAMFQEEDGLDPSKAIGYLETASAGGHIGSKIALADIYRSGEIVAKDTNKAVTLYQEALDGGNASAAGRLAALYRDGEENGLDPSQAIGFYEKAAAGGDAKALVALGDIYREDTIVPADTAKAVGYYTQASAAGNQGGILRAVSTLMNGTDAQRKQGIDLAQKSLADGVPGVAPILANAYIYGRGVAKNPRKGLELLEAAAAKDDVAASLRLVQIFVSGVGKDIPANRVRARKTLDEIAGRIPQDKAAGESVLIDAASARSQGDLGGVTAELRKLEPGAQASVLGRLRSLNANAYVHYMQTFLADKGSYSGSVNGQLTTSTIRAFNQLCRENGDAKSCLSGPLSQPARALFQTVVRGTSL